MNPAQIHPIKQMLSTEQGKQQPLLELFQESRELLRANLQNHAD
jgi:hypothetical protein